MSDFSKEQLLFRDIVSRFLKEVSTPEVVRELMASEQGYDVAVWKRLCDEAGLAGTHIPEDFGGAGFGAVELGIVAEEMGRNLYCGPFFASAVMAGHALLIGGDDEAKASLLPGIAAGTRLATLVLDDVDDLERLGSSLVVDGQGNVSGSAALVVDAHVADSLLVIARTAEGTLELVAITGDAPGVTISSHEVVDPTRKLSRVDFDGANGETVGSFEEASIEALWNHLSVALAHEMIGGAQYMFDSTVEYTKVRYQFGRPIGSFQALKHRCADLLMELELARALTHHAARCLDSGEGEPYAASMAKAAAADVYMEAVRDGIQLRGGIGFTWEDDTHLWFKRAKSSEVFLGAPHVHRERMMAMIEREGVDGDSVRTDEGVVA